jgi:hypothetical protein
MWLGGTSFLVAGTRDISVQPSLVTLALVPTPLSYLVGAMAAGSNELRKKSCTAADKTESHWSLVKTQSSKDDLLFKAESYWDPGP